MYVVLLRSLLPVVLAAILAVACGGGAASNSPTSPSGLSGSAALTAGGDFDASLASTTDEMSLLGRGNGKDKGKDKGRREAEDDDDDDDDDDDGEEDDDAAGHGHHGHVSGWVTAVGADSITVRGITVKIGPTTLIRHGNRVLTLADIEVGDHAQAKGTMVNGELMATEVKVEDAGNDNDDDEGDDDAEVKGTVSGLTGTCPTLTFNAGTTKVTTTAMTEFEDVTCAALANGNVVEVEGKKQTDGSIVASEVELESGPDEVEGRISGLTGTCPSLTFFVNGTKVTTSSSTSFPDVACTALANHTKVEVEGTKQADGSIAAAVVELD